MLNTSFFCFSFLIKFRRIALYIVLIMMILLIVYYRFHLFWIYTRYRFGLKENIPFQSCQMPYVSIPFDWVRHDFEVLQFSLPKKFTIEHQDITIGEIIGKKGVKYRCNTKELYISVPENFSPMLETASKTYSQSSISTTLPMWRYECYDIASKSFSWTMSPSDAQRYIFSVSFASNFTIFKGSKAETLFTDEMDGIAFINKNKSVFEWQCKKTFLGGYIYFQNGDGVEIGNIDNDWIRAVIQSIKIVAP